MIITVRTHYLRDDERCIGDYYSVEILDSMGKVLQEYGDAYHDSGSEKVEGFLDALRTFNMLDEVKHEDVADMEY